jgi:integration host factor subunit alpha
VQRKVGLSQLESAELVAQIIKEISTRLHRGESVKLSGFGAFSVRQKAERVGRNPKTGEEHNIAARRVVSFKASPTVKRRINQKPKDATE